jgi:hypothetical protein
LPVTALPGHHDRISRTLRCRAARCRIALHGRREHLLDRTLDLGELATPSTTSC